MSPRKSSLMVALRVALVAAVVVAYVYATRFALNFTYYMDAKCDSILFRSSTCERWDFGSFFAWNPREGADIAMAYLLGIVVMALFVALCAVISLVAYWAVTGSFPRTDEADDEEYEEYVSCKDPACSCVIHREEDVFDEKAGAWIDRREQ